MDLSFSPISFQAIKGTAKTKDGQKVKIDLLGSKNLYRVPQDDGSFKLYYHGTDRGMLHSNAYDDFEPTYSKVAPMIKANPGFVDIELNEVSENSKVGTLTMDQVNALNASWEKYNRGIKD
ncbi:MAG: hypothetical protein AB1782_01105 [Cyanobacteriota bacterium]